MSHNTSEVEGSIVVNGFSQLFGTEKLLTVECPQFVALVERAVHATGCYELLLFYMGLRVFCFKFILTADVIL